MILKNIDFDNFKQAEVIKLLVDGSIVCHLSVVDENGEVIKEEKGISFDFGCYPFELTDEELTELGYVKPVEEPVVEDLTFISDNLNEDLSFTSDNLNENV